MSANQILGCCLLVLVAAACATASAAKRSAPSNEEGEQQQLYCYEKHREQAPCVKCCNENYELCKKELGCQKNDWRCQNPCWEFVKYCDYQCKL